MLKKYQEMRAATKLAVTYRAYKQRMKHRSLVLAFTIIQAQQR